MAHGWSALEVLGEPGAHPNPLAWERECAQRALRFGGDARTAVIGKSLASFLADLVNERRLPAVWLTPVLTNSTVVGALARADRPTLLVGGTADRLWDQTAIPNNKSLEVLELDGADHSLQVPSQPSRSLDALKQMTDSLGQFLTRLGDPTPEQAV